MDRDAILTVDVAGRNGREATVGPAPVLELVYAAHYLARHRRERSQDLLPWAARLRSEQPELVRNVIALVDLRRGRVGATHVLFPVAIDGGYAWDADPERFVAELPQAARRVAERLRQGAEHASVGSANLREWFDDPPASDWADQAQAVLKRLWTQLASEWSERAASEVERAATEVRDALLVHGDALRALPPHHFAQFEQAAERLRDAAARGRLWLVPLGFAAGGGFHLELAEATVVGFGLRTEHVHERTFQQVADAAEAAKAFADRTRLMLLSMIVRYPEGSATVGDLARQLGVSQPTVSGHLKALRAAGLIRTERTGNRTYPKPERAAIARCLIALATVLEADPAEDEAEASA